MARLDWFCTRMPLKNWCWSSPDEGCHSGLFVGMLIFFFKVAWNNCTGIWTTWWCSEFWKEYLCQGLLLSPSGKGKWEQFFKGGLKLSPRVLHNIKILYDGEPQSFMHYICIEIYMQCIYKLKYKYIHGSPKEK